MSVEILSIAARLDEKSHLKGLAAGDYVLHFRRMTFGKISISKSDLQGDKIVGIASIRQATHTTSY